MDARKLIMIIIAMIFLVFNVLIVTYLIQLERIGCECAINWRRTYILFYLFLNIIYLIVSIFVNQQVLPFISAFMLILGILNVVFTLQYVAKLKEEKCDCSESVYRTIMKVIAIINAVVYCFVFVMLILTVMFAASFYTTLTSKKNTQRTKKLK